MRIPTGPVLKPAERLIVAADPKLLGIGKGDRNVAYGQVLSLADSLADLGVYLKVNFVLRACGYDLIDEIHERGLNVFADLKLFDIPATLANDGVLLRECEPELLTVACTTGIEAMIALRNELPATEVLGVTVLTSFDDGDSDAMFTCSTREAVLRLAGFAEKAGVGGFISSPVEAALLRERFGVAMTINTPAIRPTWSVVSGDDQNPERIMTPAKAIQAGADRIVVGRPITGHKSPRDAVLRTIDEIAASM